MARVIDYAWGRPSVAALKAAGAGRPVYFSVDSDPTDAQLASVGDYFPARPLPTRSDPRPATR